jgi:hypothetical protein
LKRISHKKIDTTRIRNLGFAILMFDGGYHEIHPSDHGKIL